MKKLSFFLMAFMCAGKLMAVMPTSVVVDNVKYQLVKGTMTCAGFEDKSNHASKVNIQNTVTLKDPDNGQTKVVDVRAVQDRAFFNVGLTSVTFPENLLKIGGFAFAGNNLSTITFPDKLTSIEKSAFASNPKLSEVTIPLNLVTIGESAFSGIKADAKVILNAPQFQNESLEKVFPTASDFNVGANVVSIKENWFKNSKMVKRVSVDCYKRTNGVVFQDNAFLNCVNLTTISCTKVESVGDYAFSGCRNMKVWSSSYSFDLSDVKSIGKEAFKNTGFYEYVVLEKCVSIGERAFQNTNITSVSLYAIENVEKDAFAGCNLNYVLIGTESFAAKDFSVNFNYHHMFGPNVKMYAFQVSKIGKCVLALPINPKIKPIFSKLELQPEVKTIGEGAFQNCTNLEAADLDDVRTVSKNAFAGCTNLKEVNIGSEKSGVVLNANAFENCTNLKTIRIYNAICKGLVFTGVVPDLFMDLSDNAVIEKDQEKTVVVCGSQKRADFYIGKGFKHVSVDSSTKSRKREPRNNKNLRQRQRK